jgi:hypothetical protein
MKDWVVKSSRMGWAGHVACVGKMRNAYKILIRKSEGNRPLRRPRLKWEDNIRMVLRKVGWEGVDGIHTALRRRQEDRKF